MITPPQYCRLGILGRECKDDQIKNLFMFHPLILKANANSIVSTQKIKEENLLFFGFHFFTYLLRY